MEALVLQLPHATAKMQLSMALAVAVVANTMTRLATERTEVAAQATKASFMSVSHMNSKEDDPCDMQ